MPFISVFFIILTIFKKTKYFFYLLKKKGKKNKCLLPLIIPKDVRVTPEYVLRWYNVSAAKINPIQKHVPHF